MERLVRWADQGMSPNHEYLSVECKVTESHAAWKITMKPDAFAHLSPTDPIARIIPPPPFSYEDDDLLTVIRRMEETLGLKMGDQ